MIDHASSFRVLLRPWRDGAFRLLAGALGIAAFALTAMLLLRGELNDRFNDRTAEVMGGQLVLDGSRAPEDEQRQLMEGVETATMVRFPTVLVRDDQVMLVSVKAVSSSYPLFGQVAIADSRFGEARRVPRGPEPGEAWLAGQGMDRMDLSVGDTVTVGKKTLKLTAVLRQEPDRGASFYSMNPRLLIHLEDLAATGAVARGSRLDYEVGMKGEPARLAGIQSQLEDSLRPDQELETVDENREGTLGPLRQLTLWISLAVLLVTLLCGAAIFLATGERVQRRSRYAALLRCFGASRRQVMRYLLGHELIAALPASLLGNALGVLLVLFVRRQLGWHQPMAAGIWSWILVFTGPLLLWASFALPRLVALLRTPAGEVLRAGGGRRRPALEFAAALAGPVALAAVLTQSWQEMWLTLVLLVALGTLLPALFWPGLHLLEKRSPRWPLPLRLALRRLSRRPLLTLPLLAALTLAMATLTLAGQTGNRLIQDWQNRLPEDAPNYFVLNLQKPDLPVFRDWLQRHDGESEPLYPIVRARLTAIDGENMRQAATKEKKDRHEALERDLSLTEGTELPESNRLVEGDWWDEDTPAGLVSVEKKLAGELGIGIGDRVTFVDSRGEFSAEVASIREVDWESFEPNFYFMFSPGSLAQRPSTWLTSFWLPEGSGRRLSALLRELPHITVLDVDTILEQAQEIAGQASLAANLLALLVMGAALLVLGSALMAGQGQRGRDNALLKTLGARRRLVRRVQALEFLLLGGGAALAASLLVLAALIPLGQMLFDGGLPLAWWDLLPLAAALLVTVIGMSLSRRSLEAPPLALLRE